MEELKNNKHIMFETSEKAIDSLKAYRLNERVSHSSVQERPGGGGGGGKRSKVNLLLVKFKDNNKIEQIKVVKGKRQNL